MAEVTVKAFAKLNLTLDILRRLEDGYHELRMVMQSVSLYDTVRVEQNNSGHITIKCGTHYLPTGRGNTAYRAAQAFFDALRMAPEGVHITIEKRIPVCAGMGGGSADAAAVLHALRSLYRPEMTTGQLCRIGEAVGSDVPYCVFGGTALAEGRGEILTRLTPMPDCCAVICKPPFPIYTPELFALVRVKRLRRHPDTQGVLRALETGDLQGVFRRIYNVFEDVLQQRHSEVFVIKNRLLDLGARSACMTGSGPAVFGLFTDPERAQYAAELLKRDYEQTFLASMVNVLE